MKTHIEIKFFVGGGKVNTDVCPIATGKITKAKTEAVIEHELNRVFSLYDCSHIKFHYCLDRLIPRGKLYILKDDFIYLTLRGLEEVFEEITALKFLYNDIKEVSLD